MNHKYGTVGYHRYYLNYWRESLNYWRGVGNRTGEEAALLRLREQAQELRALLYPGASHE